MRLFKNWLSERDKQLYDEIALSDKFKIALSDLGKDGVGSYFKGVGYGGLAGIAGSIAGGPAIGIPLGWATAMSVANKDFNSKHRMKKRLKK